MSAARTAPELNRKLTLEEPVRTADGAGGFVQTWTPLGVVWGEIRTGTGREAADVAAPVSRVSAAITIRAAPFGAPSRPRPEQRFREGAQIWRILSVSLMDAAPQYLTCQAIQEVVA